MLLETESGLNYDFLRCWISCYVAVDISGGETAAAPVVKKKAKGLWMGSGLDDLEDEDLTDSSDEEADEKAVAVKK